LSLRRFDVQLLRLARTRAHGPAIERAVLAYSKLGEHSYVWFATGALGYVLDHGRRPLYTRLLRTVASVETVNFAMKLLVRRRRPEAPGLPPPLINTATRLSYPSAHASTSFAAARVLSTAVPAAAIYAAAAAMAASRPYLGVHYPSDVVAGALIGAMCGWTVRRLAGHPAPPTRSAGAGHVTAG
jgi:membrane-associated phospholipid phosphatase